MNNLFCRGFGMIHSFYRKVIKEVDPFMQFWYAAFAISLLFVFVINFISALLYATTKADIFAFEYKRFLIVYGSLIGIMMLLFYKNKTKLETKARIYSGNLTTWKDCLLIIFILFALVCSFIAPIIYKNAT